MAKSTMFRIGDRVTHALAALGAVATCLVVSVDDDSGVKTYTAKNVVNGDEYTGLSASELDMVSPAPPRYFGAATIRFKDGRLVPCTILVVSKTGLSFDAVPDIVKRRPRDDSDFDAPDTYEFSPTEGGYIYGCRFHKSTNSWAVSGIDGSVVTLGVREYAEATAIPQTETADTPPAAANLQPTTVAVAA